MASLRPFCIQLTSIDQTVVAHSPIIHIASNAHQVNQPRGSPRNSGEYPDDEHDDEVFNRDLLEKCSAESYVRFALINSAA